MDSESGQWRVVIASVSERSAEVAETLGGQDWGDVRGSLVLESPILAFRATDPTVLVATIAAASSAFVTLVTALLQRRTAKDGQHIVLEFESGAKIDVPADIDPERLADLVGQVEGRPKRVVLP